MATFNSNGNSTVAKDHDEFAGAVNFLINWYLISIFVPVIAWLCSRSTIWGTFCCFEV